MRAPFHFVGNIYIDDVGIDVRVLVKKTALKLSPAVAVPKRQKVAALSFPC